MRLGCCPTQVMVRPSYVLGGRAMEIVYSDKDLKRYIENAVEVCALPLPAAARARACKPQVLTLERDRAQRVLDK